MIGLLALAAGLAVPHFEPVSACDPIGVLRWENSLFRDTRAGFFQQSDFLPQTQWIAAPEDTTGGRVVADCFATPTPHDRDVVVHKYPRAPLSPPQVRPVLLVTGAGDNALRSMSFLAVQLSRAGFTVYSLTFAHRHGDNYQQAEQISNVLSYMGEQHPGVKLDVVAYSKGGVAARIYASNVEGTEWPLRPDYEAEGADYRGDIGRLILLGAPNAGLDTAFRWPSSNLFSVGENPLDAPTSWTTYRANLPWVDLEAQSIYAAGGNYFPGQSQMLADLSDAHALPGAQPSLGAYQLSQLDYLTTYYGGAGFVSDSLGIAQAIEDGDHTIATLQGMGVGADIDLYVAGGGNPIMSVGGLDGTLLDSFWGDLEAAERRMTWETLAESQLDLYFPWAGEAFADDLPRLWAGTAFLGEISGPSDGLLFVDSALATDGLTLRGARLVETRLFQGLNHAELPAAGQLAAEFYGDPELSGGLYDERLAAKYARADNQSVEWIIEVLSGPVPEMPPEPPTPDGGIEADAGVINDAGMTEHEDAAFDDDMAVSADSGEKPTTDAEGGGHTAPNDASVDGGDGGRSGGNRFGGSCSQNHTPGDAPIGLGMLLLSLGLLRRK